MPLIRVSEKVKRVLERLKEKNHHTSIDSVLRSILFKAVTPVLLEEYRELEDKIRGKTVREIRVDMENQFGFDIVFTDGTILELYGHIGWIVSREGEEK